MSNFRYQLQAEIDGLKESLSSFKISPKTTEKDHIEENADENVDLRTTAHVKNEANENSIQTSIDHATSNSFPMTIHFVASLKLLTNGSNLC